MQLNWLLPIINSTKHDVYVELFGGGASVLLNKEPSKCEVYNDIYEDVTIFFRVLRDNGDKLLDLLSLTPYSRTEYCNSLDRKDESDLEQARRFFTTARQVTNGLASTATPGRWGSTKISRRGMSLVVSRWLSAIDGLQEVVARLKEVQIDNRNYVELLRQYDGLDTLFYCDPPYPNSVRPGGRAYKFEFTDDDQLRFLESLQDIKGMVLLSSYDNELYRKKLANWNIHIEKSKSISSSRRFNGRQQQEILFSNYTINV